MWPWTRGSTVPGGHGKGAQARATACAKTWKHLGTAGRAGWGQLEGGVGVEEVGRHPVPGGGPPARGQGPGQEGAGWLSRCPNWFISVADFLLLLRRKCSHGPGGASLGGAGREGRKEANRLPICLGLSTAFSEPPWALPLGLGDPGQVTYPLWASVSLCVKSEGWTR